jgi:hypothetical protein
MKAMMLDGLKTEWTDESRERWKVGAGRRRARQGVDQLTF